MEVFQNFAAYYDLLYENKDYIGEADFVHELLGEYGQQSTCKLLELGCGTGKHAMLLAQKGYNITAIDRSPTMLEMAGKLLQENKMTEKVKIQQGDICHLNLNATFDAIISLFHVVSYQVSQKELLSLFETVKKHLNPGGIFIFDCWYGPAVLFERPMVRYKTLRNDQLQIERVALPCLEVNSNTVKIDYHLYVKEKDKSYFKMEETHLMRYFFLPEMEHLINQFNMTLMASFEWQTRAKLSETTWGACFVVKA